MLALALAALLLAALASAQLDVTVLEQLSEADYPLAKCNDGTQVTVCLSAVSLCCIVKTLTTLIYISQSPGRWPTGGRRAATRARW